MSHRYYLKLCYNPSNIKKESKMKKLNIAALLFGAFLFLGLGTSALAAEKCGAGKWGDDKKVEKCGAGKCGADKKASTKAMKCGAGKCGGDKNTTKKAMKCGAGKCGSK